MATASESRYGNPANYNATPATRTEAEPSALEVDINGNLKTVLGASSPVNVIVPDSTITNPTSNFTRPADTTAYAVGDLVANNVTAGSVVPLSWSVARVATGNCFIRRVRLSKSTNATTNASFRLHLYRVSPTCTNGDNGAWLTTESTYLGSFDLDLTTAGGRVFSDPAVDGIGVPNQGSEVAVALASGQTIFGLLEARAAYTPGSAEVFTVILEVFQN